MSAKVIAIVNQKGGVGKTTTAMNIATTLVALGRKVLVVDLDGQGNASTGLGIELSARAHTTYDVIMNSTSLEDAMVGVPGIEGLYMLPASTDLSSVDSQLVNDKGRIVRLKIAIASVEEKFDYVFVDCPPSLSILTVNALAAADSVLVPLQCEFFALEGLSQLISTVNQVRESANPRLKIQGVLLTMYDQRNRLTVQVEEDVRENLGSMVYQAVIPRNVRLSEAPSYGLPAMLYDPKSSGATAYQSAAIEFLTREGDLEGL